MKQKIIILILLASVFVSSLLFLDRRTNTLPQNPFIASVQPSSTATPTPIATIGLVGDLGLGRHITSTARSKNDFSYSFSGLSSWLQKNDFNLANLESPIIADCPTGYTGTFTFCGDTRFLPQLVDNKFILNLANNHIFNYGQDGYQQTLNFLTQNQISHFYSLDPVVEFNQKTINGISFGFLGYDFITNPNLDYQTIFNAVDKYDPKVDWLIVSLHWGNEYRDSPEQWRVDLGHQLVDRGVDIVHGHHPHVWQDLEIYRDKPIFYSLGNFIFDQSWSYATSHTQIARLTVTKDKILDQQLFPVEIQNNSRPVLMSQ